MESLGTFEQLVLFAAVQLGAEAYGVTIREALEEKTKRAYSAGAINTALARMEERGLVRSRVGDATSGRAGRPPKYYTVEPKGARALLAAYSALQTVASGALPELTSLAEG